VYSSCVYAEKKTHTYTQKHAFSLSFSLLHTHAHAHAHAHAHTLMHVHIYEQVQTHTDIRGNANTHTQTDTDAFPRMHYTHTYTDNLARAHDITPVLHFFSIFVIHNFQPRSKTGNLPHAIVSDAVLHACIYTCANILVYSTGRG